MMTDNFDEKVLSILEDKKELIKFLVKAAMDSVGEKNGLVKLSESLTRPEPNLKPENMARCISSTMLTLAKQAHRMETLAIVALIQVSSNDFDADMAKLLMKLGKGDQAVKTMYENKLSGK